MPFDDLLKRLKDAGNELVSPVEEPNENDYSMLPTDKLSGQGFSKIFNAIGALQPEQQPLKANLPNGMGQINIPMIDPTGLMGMGTLKEVSEAGKIGKEALDMSKEARLARAKEMGFNTEQPAYHGTTGDIKSFDDKFLGTNTGANSAKKAYFFGSDPSTASDYASTGLRREAIEKKADLKALQKQYSDLFNSKGNGLNFFTESTPEEKNLLDTLSNKSLDLKKEINAVPYNYEDKDANVLKTYLKTENPYIHDFKGDEYRDKSFSDLIDQAKKAGHDSVIFKNAYDPAMKNNNVMQDITAVFNPQQIRSVNAEFNPLNKDSSNILAGLGGAGILSSQLNDNEQDQNFQKLKQLLNK